MTKILDNLLQEASKIELQLLSEIGLKAVKPETVIKTKEAIANIEEAWPKLHRSPEHKGDLLVKDTVIKRLQEAIKSGLVIVGPLDAYELADLIHDKTCFVNHTDQCGYHYDKWDGSTNTTKSRYYNVAQKLMLKYPITTIAEIVTVIRSV